MDTPTLTRTRLAEMVTPIHSTQETTVRFSANHPRLEAVVRDLLAGLPHNQGWLVDRANTAYLMIGTRPDTRVAVAFAAPEHDAFIRAVAASRAITLAVEGMFPVTLLFNQGVDGALNRYARFRGWQ